MQPWCIRNDPNSVTPTTDYAGCCLRRATCRGMPKWRFVAGAGEVPCTFRALAPFNPFLWNDFINTHHADTKSPRRHWGDLPRCPRGLDLPVAASTVQRQTPVPRSRARSGRSSGERMAIASRHRCSCSKRRWRSGRRYMRCQLRLSCVNWYGEFAPAVQTC
jgi:hypothetical protein